MAKKLIRPLCTIWMGSPMNDLYWTKMQFIYYFFNVFIFVKKLNQIITSDLLYVLRIKLIIEWRYLWINFDVNFFLVLVINSQMPTVTFQKISDWKCWRKHARCSSSATTPTWNTLFPSTSSILFIVQASFLQRDLFTMACNVGFGPETRSHCSLKTGSKSIPKK